jgi:hypothetical protein
MKLIKIINGSIHLEHYIHNEDNNLSIGLYAISFTNSNNLIKIENDCQITIDKNIINIKSGQYTKGELNTLVFPLVISFVDKKIKIESPCYYKLDENLKKYLGFKDPNFIRTSTKSMIYYPLEDEHYINIEKDCEFIVKTEKLVLGTFKISTGIYSISEIEKLLNVDINVCNTKLTIVDQFLKISTNYDYDLDSYLLNTLGIPLLNFITDYKTEFPFNRTVTGNIKLNFYTQGFLKDINGVIETKDSKTVIEKKNYTIDQLNKLVPANIKLQLINNNISITYNDYYSLDENLRLSLGFDDKYAYKHTGSDIILGFYFVNKFLEIHCDIIMNSISNHKTEKYLHTEDDILCVIKCDNEGQYIANDIKYIPLNLIKFKNIKLFITDQDGNKVICDEFVAYLILKL